MRVLQTQRGGGLRRPLRALVGLAAAMMIVGGGLVAGPAAAYAADSDVVNIPDANLKAAINRTLTNRPLDQGVTVADAAAVTTITASDITGPIGDLTGLAALTNLTTFQMPTNLSENGYSDLTPLSDLNKLTNLALGGGQIADLAPLQDLTALKSLVLSDNKITDLSPLSGLTHLTALYLNNNQVKDASGIPAAPSLATLNLSGNKIADVAPLAE
jgi:Leucine-rich repeat (LRR) protein